MNLENLAALVRFRLEQSEESLRAAQELQKIDLPREAINRAYYAMFYAVPALLATKKKETSKHQGAIALFDRDFVRSEIFSKEFSRWLHAAFNLRLRSDYSPLFQPSKQQSDMIVARAEAFVSGVRTRLLTFLSDIEENSREQDSSR